MKSKLSLIILGLGIIVLTTGMNGGCGEPISESVSYGSPNWMTDGRIVANKTVVREKQKGIIPGYMTYETIFRAEYIVTMKDDGTDEKTIYGGEDKYGKIGGIVASPLGNYLAYGGYANGQHNITIITADGSRESKIISLDALANSFDWSPDEARMVYADYISEDMFVIRVSDEVKTKIATQAADVAWRIGEIISYSNLYIVNSDGTQNSYLVAGRYAQKLSTSEVIYQGADFGVYKINIDGTAINKLFSGYDRASLKLSFDGTKIVGGGGIWVVNIDGTNLKKLRD